MTSIKAINLQVVGPFISQEEREEFSLLKRRFTETGRGIKLPEILFGFGVLVGLRFQVVDLQSWIRLRRKL